MLSTITYKPLNNIDDLLIGTGQNIIVTGWTPREAVAKKLDTKDYAVIGQLYNPMYGISYLLANLLANPSFTHIHILYTLKQDRNTKSGLALYYFFQNGVAEAEDEWQILDPESGTVVGKINKVFSLPTLEALREKSRYHVYFHNSVEQLITAVKSIHPELNSHKYAAQEITIPKTPSLTSPGNLYGHHIEGETISEVWLQALIYIRKNGRLVGDRQEVINLVSVIHNEPQEFSIQKWMPTDRERLQEYVKEVTLGTKVDNISYTYGTRLRKAPLGTKELDQVTETAKKIVADKNSTRLVLSLWVTEVDFYSNNPPCLTQIWFRVVENKLAICVTFRSHDIFIAYTDNLMALRRLQDVIIQKVAELDPTLNLSPGPIICNSESAHIYSRCFEDVDKLTKRYYKYKEVYKDSVGNFLVNVDKENQQLVISHYSPKSEFVCDYSYKLSESPLSIVRDLVYLNPTIKATHLAYLGLEIQRALECAKTDTLYTQDKL